LVGGGGGYTRFYNSSSGGNAAFITEGNGLFDISFLASSGTTVGSIAGSGNYSLGAKSLAVGSLNTDTTVSGSISGAGGTLTKVGSGTFTISAFQSYATLNADGGTTILASALGSGASTLNVNAIAEIRASQTLAALNIGDGAVVTLEDALPAPALAEGSQFENAPALLESTAFSSPRGVPEPAATSLFLAGILSMLGSRRFGRYAFRGLCRVISSR
jgi:hypothetical protein